ncbi:hypothetical protein ACF0H5_019643 [Mactra antiquata]
MPGIKPRRYFMLVVGFGTMVLFLELFYRLDDDQLELNHIEHNTNGKDHLKTMPEDKIDFRNVVTPDIGRETEIMNKNTSDNRLYKVKIEPENVADTSQSSNIDTEAQTMTDTADEGDEPVNEYLQPSELYDENNEFDISSLDDQIILSHTPDKNNRNNNNNNKNKNNDNKQASAHDEILLTRRLYKWNGDYEQILNTTEQYRRAVYKAFHRPMAILGDIDCSAIIRHDETELAKARGVMQQLTRRSIPVEKYARTVDCENFRGGRGYVEHPLSQIELNFPLAFGLIVYRDVEQIERLIRSIYRPHNFYCIHIDSKLQMKEKTALQRVANCLDNVYIADKSINVTWGEFSVLEAELICMELLLQHKRWKYYINLTGQEFPLKTNKEIVSILQSLDGANIVDGTWIRAREKYFYRWTQAGHPPPHKIRPIKGSVHVAVNRHFVNFAINDERARDFLQWLKRTQIPDETFFASLNHNPSLGINGSFLGEAEEYPLKPSLMRYKNWELGHSVFVRKCEGKFVRNICILGVGDLHHAYNDIGLFVNKFMIDFEYLGLDCLEKVLYEKTWKQYLDDEYIDTGYYKRLDYVKKKLVVQS